MVVCMDEAKEKLINLAKSSLKEPASKKTSEKKIVTSSAHSSLRELFKKTFLPLLIDVSELRLKLEDCKLQKTSGRLFQIGSMDKSPEDILKRLEQLQDDIAETRRWCEGVISQIDRGIEETKELLAFLGKGIEQIEQPPIRKRFFKKK